MARREVDPLLSALLIAGGGGNKQVLAGLEDPLVRANLLRCPDSVLIAAGMRMRALGGRATIEGWLAACEEVALRRRRATSRPDEPISAPWKERVPVWSRRSPSDAPRPICSALMPVDHKQFSVANGRARASGRLVVERSSSHLVIGVGAPLSVRVDQGRRPQVGTLLTTWTVTTRGRRATPRSPTEAVSRVTDADVRAGGRAQFSGP